MLDVELAPAPSPPSIYAMKLHVIKASVSLMKSIYPKIEVWMIISNVEKKIIKFLPPSYFRNLPTK